MRARRMSPRAGRHRGSWPPLSLAALALVLALGACSTPAQLPAAGPSGGAAGAAQAPPARGASAAAPAAPSGSQAGAAGAVGAAPGADWDTTLAAARQEGQVVCGCPAIPVIRELLASEFAAAFPGIQLEMTPALPPDWSARVQTERAAGQYLWDVFFFGPSPDIFQLASSGVFDPVLPALLRADVNQPEIWGGWDKTLLDSQGQYVFAFWQQLGSRFIYNATDQSPAGSIDGFRDLLAPKYKGKIAWWDPRNGAGGLDYATFINATLGEQTLRQLVVDQEPAFVSSSAQVIEDVVRGTHFVGMGSGGQLAPSLKPFIDAGVKVDMQLVAPRSPVSETASYGTTALLNRPPHPNAARVFLNWLLSADMQTKLSRVAGQNSRRSDVPAGDPASAVQPGMDVIQTQREDFITRYHLPTLRLIREWRPQ